MNYYSIKNNRIKGPFNLSHFWKEDPDFHEFSLEPQRERFVSRRQDYLSEKELIGKEVYLLGKDPAILVNFVNDDEVQVRHIYYIGIHPFSCGECIYSLKNLSLQPSENFSLTNEQEESKVPEMNNEITFDQVSGAIAQFLKSGLKIEDALKLTEKVIDRVTTLKSLSEITVQNTLEITKEQIEQQLFNLRENKAEALLKLAAQSNKKILVLDSRRDVLKQAFTIGAGTQIDIMRDDDSRIGQKNYDLIVGDLPANKVPDTQKSFDYSVETVQTKLPEVTAEQILEGAVYPNYKIILVASSYRNAKVAFERIERMADDKGISTEVSKGTDRLEMKIGDSKIIATSLTEKVRGYRGNCIVITDKVNQKQLDELILPLLTIKDSNPFFPYVTLLNFKWD